MASRYTEIPPEDPDVVRARDNAHLDDNRIKAHPASRPLTFDSPGVMDLGGVASLPLNRPHERSSSRLRDLTGGRFGKLVVLERAPNQGNATAWLCACDCGNKVEIRGEWLCRRRSDRPVKSCGCLKHLPMPVDPERGKAFREIARLWGEAYRRGETPLQQRRK